MRIKEIESRSYLEEGSTLSANEYDDDLTLSADEFLEDDDDIRHGGNPAKKSERASN